MKAREIVFVLIAVGSLIFALYQNVRLEKSAEEAIRQRELAEALKLTSLAQEENGRKQAAEAQKAMFMAEMARAEAVKALADCGKRRK